MNLEQGSSATPSPPPWEGGGSKRGGEANCERIPMKIKFFSFWFSSSKYFFPSILVSIGHLSLMPAGWAKVFNFRLKKRGLQSG